MISAGGPDMDVASFPRRSEGYGVHVAAQVLGSSIGPDNAVMGNGETTPGFFDGNTPILNGTQPALVSDMTATMTLRSRTAILVTLLGAFEGVRGDLNEAEVEVGMKIIETEFDCDLAAVKRSLDKELLAGMRACALVEAVMKGDKG